MLRTVTDDGERLGRADLHVHTTYSDGSHSPRQVVDAGIRAGLDVLAVTDHDTIEGALVAADRAVALAGLLEVIVGEEVSSRDGHILGLYLRGRVEPGLSGEETIIAIREQGGLAIAAHPFWRTVRRPGKLPHGVGPELLPLLPFDALEGLNGGVTPSMWTANRLALQAAGMISLPTVGGSDAHIRQAVAWGWTAFEGRTAADLRAAILAGRVWPGRRLPGFLALWRYLGWALTVGRKDRVPPLEQPAALAR